MAQSREHRFGRTGTGSHGDKLRVRRGVGTNGVTGLFEIRKTTNTGTLVGTTGALTVVATNLRSDSCIGIDTSPTLPGQVYVLALTVGSGSAGSTVGFVRLAALVV
jgi:hypothetical protein